MKLIDADALIKHLNTTFYRDVMEEIKHFPEADEDVLQQFLNKRCKSIVTNEYLVALHNSRMPKIGVWKLTKHDTYTSERYCSNCYAVVDGYHQEGYCQYCGSKMTHYETPSGLREYIQPEPMRYTYKGGDEECQ